MKMTPTPEKCPEDRVKRRKLTDEARVNAEEHDLADPKTKRDGAQQKAKRNKKSGRKKMPPTRVTRAVKICPRPENIPVSTFPIPPNGPYTNCVLTNENAYNTSPCFTNGGIAYPPPIMQPQHLPHRGAAQQSQDGQARIMEPQQLPHGGAGQHARDHQDRIVQPQQLPYGGAEQHARDRQDRIVQPQQLPYGGPGQQARDRQAKIVQPQRLPYGGARPQSQSGQARNVPPKTANRKLELNTARKSTQNAPGAQLQPRGTEAAPKRPSAKNTQMPKQNTLGAQTQSHGNPNTEVPHNTHVKNTQKPIQNIPGSQQQPHGIPQPRGIPNVEIPKNMPRKTIQLPTKRWSRSRLLPHGMASIETPEETHARIAHMPVPGNPGAQLQSTKIARVELPKNTASRDSQNPLHYSSGSLLRIQSHVLSRIDIPPQNGASNAQNPRNAADATMQIRGLSKVNPKKHKPNAADATMQIRGLSKVNPKKHKPKGSPRKSRRNTSHEPHHQPRCRDLEIGRSAQENRADPKPAAQEYASASAAHLTHKSNIGVQPPARLSGAPQNLQNAQPQRLIPANYSSIDQRSNSNTETSSIPFWAVGRPLCHYLFHIEIWDPDHRLHSQYPSSPANSKIRVADPPLTEDIDPETPTTLPHQPYLTWTWAHENSYPKPMDNLTSFSRAFPSGIQMWPCLSLKQIRDKKFLASCHDKILLRHMGRYLTEHALDQIARCDPSSKLEPKWLVTPKNLYERGTRSLIQNQDKQEGYRCSCKRVKEQNRSGRYGVCCSDEMCENRAMNIECVPGKCGGGESCKNVRIQKQQFPRFILQKSLEKGYGVLAREMIASGTMIGEYLGEVLDEEMFQERVMEYEGEQNFYFMRLTSKLYIDASRKGGIGRFINHSCDPNCIAEKWNAGGGPHIAIVAIRDIKPFEEITFCYQAQLVGTRPVKCVCGSKNCKGWLAARSLSSNSEGSVGCCEMESVVAKKIELAHSDIALAEEILQKVYGL